MGCAQSASEPSELGQNSPMQGSKIRSAEILAETEATARQLAERFSVVRSMAERLDKTAYSTEQVMSLADAIISAALELENVETPAEKQAVQQFFNHNCQQLHKTDKLYYHQLVKMFKESISKKRLKPESQSRMYNLIANFKQKLRLGKSDCNRFNVYYSRINVHKELSEAELDEVVKLDGVAEKILSLGEKLNFKFNSILQETGNMANLLSKCFKEYHNHILGLKYDLEPKEIETVAKISRQACDSHDNGVFLLLVYFVKACANLEQNQNKPVTFIQDKMEKALEMITKEYPPGQGLTNEQQHLRQALVNLAFPANEEDKKKAKFEHPAEPLGPKNKQAQLEQIIMKYAKIAKHNKPHFEELVRKTCVNLCLQTKIGLKYYPDNPNEKALTRIKEKMLFKKDGNAEKPSWPTIAETIKGEAKSYKKQVNKLLAKKTEVQFKISDMVRGKCTFISIPDIMETIDQIKRFVAEDEQKRFRITEIESRFTNKVPISDVTLKIAINEEIVAQLQLTVQTNAPAYNFAHKIYELQRTKVFSKVKIVHNYFEEFKQDFKEVCKRSLELSNQAVGMIPEQDSTISRQHQRAAVICQHSKIIYDYFDLSQVQPLQLKEALKITLHKQLEERVESVPKFMVAGDQKLQHLILPLFNKQMGHWYQTLGKAINNVLTSTTHSEALKDTLVNYFLKGFSISKEAHKMRQFFSVYRQIATRERGYGQSQFKDGKDFMQFYLKHNFQIENILDRSYSFYSVFLKVWQIRNLTLKQQYENGSVLLKISRVVLGVVVEDSSPDLINFMRDILDSYFILRKENRQLCDQFSFIYNWLIAIFELNQQLDTRIVSSQVKLLGAQKLLQKKKAAEAITLLQQAIKVFKQEEQHIKCLEAQLLLTDALAQDPKKKVNEVQQFYQKIVEKAKNLGIEMRGVAVANAEWRIAESLWKKLSMENVAKHFCCAVSESSRCEGEGFILKWNEAEYWMAMDSQKTVNKFQEGLEIKPNETIVYINLFQQKIGDKGCQHLARAKWKNLTALYLRFNNIGAEGCQYLAKADWKNLVTLQLGSNQIGAEGCQHLAKADWKNLTTLDLHDNRIGNEGCEYLAKANWKNLTTLDLHDNRIGNEGCEYLAKANWKYLTTLDLGLNNIGAEGCQYLVKADWKKLATLILQANSIEDKGCQILAKAGWKNLATLYLNSNRIGTEGCQYFAKAAWKDLATVYLGSNQIGAEGCQHLAKADWKNLTTMSLEFNQIGVEGCQYLAKADWKKLAKLKLNNNQIPQVEQKRIRQFFRQKELQIEW